MKSSGFRRKTPSIKKLSRRLSQIPIPAKNLWVDQYSCLIKPGTQGMHVVSGLAFMAGSIANTPELTSGSLSPLFTSSPLDLGLVLGQAFQNITFAGPPGAVKFNLHHYSHTCQFTNAGNHPVKITRYALLCRRDIPSMFSITGPADATKPGYFTWDYIVSLMGNTQLQASNTSTTASVLGTLASINPWMASAGPNAITAVTMPGFVLNDIPQFRHYFKFKGTRHKELAQGRSVKWSVKSSKLRSIDTANFIESAQYAASGLFASLRLLAMKGSIHYVYKFEPMTGTTTGGGNINTTIDYCSVSNVQTYRYLTSVSSQPTHQMYGAAAALPNSVAVYNYAPFTSTAAAAIQA